MKKILLCTGIQYANIGDVGHVTGILTLLRQHLPDLKVTLCTTIDVESYHDLLRRNWPELRIVHTERPKPGAGVQSLPRDVRDAAQNADFIISGHSMGRITRCLTDAYQRPYGFVGVAVDKPPSGQDLEHVDNASFFFPRDTASLANLKRAGARCPVMRFAPDATFGADGVNAEAAAAFLKDIGLAGKPFLCVVPRLRVTPYYRIEPRLRANPEPWPDQRIREVEALNKAHQEEDHAKVRTVMTNWVRSTGNPVLCCPEMIHNIDLFDELLLDALPPDVRPQVYKRESFWLPDEAAAVYQRAFAVLSLECHSPILAAVQGTPACYLRQPEDGIKGQMWHDLGLSDWVFEIEQSTGSQLSERLLAIYADPTAAQEGLRRARQRIRVLQAEQMRLIGDMVTDQ